MWTYGCAAHVGIEVCSTMWVHRCATLCGHRGMQHTCGQRYATPCWYRGVKHYVGSQVCSTMLVQYCMQHYVGSGVHSIMLVICTLDHVGTNVCNTIQVQRNTMSSTDVHSTMLVQMCATLHGYRSTLCQVPMYTALCWYKCMQHYTGTEEHYVSYRCTQHHIGTDWLLRFYTLATSKVA